MCHQLSLSERDLASVSSFGRVLSESLCNFYLLMSVLIFILSERSEGELIRGSVSNGLADETFYIVMY